MKNIKVINIIRAMRMKNREIKIAKVTKVAIYRKAKLIFSRAKLVLLRIVKIILINFLLIFLIIIIIIVV
jgi:hypothetical protein